MHYFYDLEFHEDGSTIDPISIGIVAEDGREYYAVNADARWGYIRSHAWLMSNVVPHLPDLAQRMVESGTSSGHSKTHPIVKPRWRIAAEVSEFVRAAGDNRDDHELWAYYGAYDHVALCQLWGRMIDLPAWVPMHTNDLKQSGDGLAKNGFEVARPQQQDEHHALADARWNRELYWAQANVVKGALIPAGHVLLKEPTAARLVERMLSVGPNEGISPQEEADLRAWWETYDYPPGEPEAGDGGDEFPPGPTDEEWAKLEAQQDADDKAEGKHLEEWRVLKERGEVA